MDIKSLNTENWMRVYLPFVAKFHQLRFDPNSIDRKIKNYFFNFSESNCLSDSRDKIIKYFYLFDLIFTTDSYLINRLDNAIYMPLGNSWINGSIVENTSAMHKIKTVKNFSVSTLMSNVRHNKNYDIRFDFWNRRKEIKIPTDFYGSVFSPIDYKRTLPGNSISDKYVLYNSMFNISFENLNSDENNFSQRLVDCFLTKVIPV